MGKRVRNIYKKSSPKILKREIVMEYKKIVKTYLYKKNIFIEKYINLDAPLLKGKSKERRIQLAYYAWIAELNEVTNKK
jgi:hypothetical protein